MSVLSKLLDRSIVFSFDRTGFNRHRKSFRGSDLDVDLRGRHIVITGANSGIGFASASALAAMGATITLVCRSEERALKAKHQILSDTAKADLRIVLADLSNLESIRAAAPQISGPINALIHNAGNMLDERVLTADGLESITALHVAGPYLLTTLLRPQLEAAGNTGPVRVVFVASGGMYTQSLDLEQLNRPVTPYDGTRHYALTKRAQVVLAERMHARWSSQGVSVHSMHPGWVDTPAIRRAMPYFFKVTQPILRTREQGADTIVWLAACPDSAIDANSGFWFDRARAPLHMSKKTTVTKDLEAQLIPIIEDWLQ